MSSPREASVPCRADRKHAPQGRHVGLKIVENRASATEDHVSRHQSLRGAIEGRRRRRRTTTAQKRAPKGFGDKEAQLRRQTMRDSRKFFG